MGTCGAGFAKDAGLSAFFDFLEGVGYFARIFTKFSWAKKCGSKLRRGALALSTNAI